MTWYAEDHFTAFFRGSSDDLRRRYTELAKEFIGCDPVVDLGFGRGEFMELLTELGVEVRGVEPDPQLVDERARPRARCRCRARGRVPAIGRARVSSAAS